MNDGSVRRDKTPTEIRQDVAQWEKTLEGQHGDERAARAGLREAHASRVLSTVLIVLFHVFTLGFFLWAHLILAIILRLGRR